MTRRQPRPARAARALAALLGLLACGAGPAAADDTIWLRLAIVASAPGEAAETEALQQGLRLGPVTRSGSDRAYPLPGYVPVSAAALREQGLAIASGRAHAAKLRLRWSEPDGFLLSDPDGTLLAVLPAEGAAPLVGTGLPLYLLRPVLPPDPGDADKVADARASGLAPPLRIASAAGSLGGAMRAHQAGIRKRRQEPLRHPVLAYRPGGRLEPEAAPQSGSPVSLGANLQDRWLFTSVPAGAAVAFAGISEQAATEVAIRNLPAAAARSMVMRKDGYRDCTHAEARKEVVARGGLEWNAVRCMLQPLAGE